MSDTMAPLYTPGSRAIQDYCHALAEELGLTLGSVWWGCALHPDHPQDPYHLTMSITQPFEWLTEFWFTRGEVMGYAVGETTEAVNAKIRADVEAYCRVWKQGREEG
jgi:hypothetical protein